MDTVEVGPLDSVRIARRIYCSWFRFHMMMKMRLGGENETWVLYVIAPSVSIKDCTVVGPVRSSLNVLIA